ncbi:MAG: GIY-YIG nuclease family protein [Candidatus Kuenenia sp.]|nr:GIY-YIG nuclease family protein [Candidatus Kuenenia hertensis]
MNKQEILSEIKRLAEANGGKAPGFQRFFSETGLRKGDWYPKLWLRWGDAINEAGCDSNKFISAYDTDFLIERYIELIRELGHFPIEGELRLKRKNDENFPSHSGFAQLGGKQERIEKIIEYCLEKNEYADIVVICEEISNLSQKREKPDDNSSECIGYVYLIKHGNRNEYKIGMTNNPIRREGELRLELPEKVKPIHYIETDDPYGIEKYWHNRFSNKRKEGEWFSLSSNDVKAFKRWKRIY